MATPTTSRSAPRGSPPTCSFRRRGADAVAKTLTAHLTDPKRVQCDRARVSADPIASNATREGRQQNRRTEIVLAKLATPAMMGAVFRVAGQSLGAHPPRRRCARGPDLVLRPADRHRLAAPAGKRHRPLDPVIAAIFVLWLVIQPGAGRSARTARIRNWRRASPRARRTRTPPPRPRKSRRCPSGSGCVDDPGKAPDRRQVAGGCLYQLPVVHVHRPARRRQDHGADQLRPEFPARRRARQAAARCAGVGGTRNCDWWFTDEAVLIDTAGRYTTQDSDARGRQAAWLGFLRLLKKHRRAPAAERRAAWRSACPTSRC